MEAESSHWIPTWKKAHCPQIKERGCHSITVMDDLLIAFGGWDGSKYFNDVLALNLNDMKWQNVTMTGETPICRYTHSANLYQKDKIIIVGGYAGRAGVLNETSVLTLVNREPLTFEWKKIQTKGQKFHRSDHTANIYGNRLYLFGGADIEEESTDELWVLDLTDFKWIKLNPVGEKPEDRYGHVSVMYNETLYIFGGLSTHARDFLTHFWQININELKWSRTLLAELGGPGPRLAATAQEVEGKMIIFGGYCHSYTNEMFSFDLKSHIWTKVETQGKLPLGRAYHAAAYYKGRYIVWGGEKSHANCISSIYECQLGESKKTNSINKTDTKFVREKDAVSTLNKISHDKLFTDIVFEVENEEIKAHKAILAGGCRYFYNMFTSGMAESQAEKIKIIDVAAPTFKALLKFLYCEDIELDYRLAIELLGLAEKYGVNNLRELCEGFLAEALTKENVVELSNIAECFEANNLKNYILKFKKKNW